MNLPEPDFTLTSARNPRIRETALLRRRREREKHQRMLIEGRREIQCALRHNHPLEALFFCPEHFSTEDQARAADILTACRQANGQLIQVSPAAFQQFGFREHPDGFLAVGVSLGQPLTSLPLRTPPLLVVAEAMEKPGNLGAIFRCADGAGADAVILCDPATDLSNPNILRASVGTVFSLPAATATSLEVRDFLRDREITAVAATPAANQCYWELDLSRPTALVIGSEHNGLTAGWLENSLITPVRIPMLGEADSLNASMAAGLLLYEARRQRQQAGIQPRKSFPL